MISINKFFAVALIASVLLSAAFAEEQETAEEPKGQTGLAGKIIGGIKKATGAVMSHLQPYLGGFKQGGGDAAPAADEAATEEASGEEPKEEESAEESAEEPKEEESAEEPKEEESVEESKEEEKSE